MTKIRISQLVWDGWNLEHIKKHKIEKQEIEEATKNIKAHRKGYVGRMILIGRSGKRILSIIAAKERSNKYYIITARDADKKERRLLYGQESKKNS